MERSQKLSGARTGEHPPYWKGALFGITAVSIWAGWMAVTRLGVTTTLDSLDVAALRFSVAGLVLLPVIIRQGWALDRLGWPRLVLLVSGAGAPYALVSAQGLKYAPAADAGALTPGVMPLFVAILSAYLLHEVLNRSRKFGLGLIFVGLLVIVGGSFLSGSMVESTGHAFFFLWCILVGQFHGNDALGETYTVARNCIDLGGIDDRIPAVLCSTCRYTPIRCSY